VPPRQTVALDVDVQPVTAPSRAAKDQVVVAGTRHDGAIEAVPVDQALDARRTGCQRETRKHGSGRDFQV
jgi:hypothetical protein